MKKAILTTAVASAFYFAAAAQNVAHPTVEQSDNYSATVAKIETGKQYTVVSFDYTAPSDGAWIEVNKEMFLQTDVDNKHYDFVKAENIAVAPETRTTLKSAGDKHTFKVYFKKLPANAKTIDIIERAGRANDGLAYFNFYNISLTSPSSADGQHVKVTQVLLTPPPINGGPITSEGNEMSNMMSAMGPMYSGLIRSMLDAQLNFYKQPGKLAEVAKMHKQYFDALVKEGFTYEQAIKILTANPLMQMTGSAGK